MQSGKMMENIECALCHSSSFTEILVASSPDLVSEEKYHVVKCNRCNLIFTNPRPLSGALLKFYTQQYYGRLKVYPFDFIEKILIYFQKLRIEKIKKIIPYGIILDIGCGKGLFLKSLEKEGFNVYGVELPQTNRRNNFLPDLNIAFGKLDDLQYSESFFDVITLWHVFEHVSNPRELLREIKRIIKPEGTLIMSMPNFESLEARIARTNWFHLDLPRHLYHYTPTTLKKMLEAEGFKIIKKEYFSVEFGPFGLLQTMMNLLGGEFNFLAKVLKGNPLYKFRLKQKYYALGLILFLIPYLPCILLFSIIEAWCQKGGILEIYAKIAR